MPPASSSTWIPHRWSVAGWHDPSEVRSMRLPRPASRAGAAAPVTLVFYHAPRRRCSGRPEHVEGRVHRVGQHQRECVFQQMTDRPPVHPRPFQRDVGAPVRSQPVTQRQQRRRRRRRAEGLDDMRGRPALVVHPHAGHDAVLPAHRGYSTSIGSSSLRRRRGAPSSKSRNRAPGPRARGARWGARGAPDPSDKRA